MAYGVNSPYQQGIKPIARMQNKNQYDTFYFTDLHEYSNTTALYSEGGTFVGGTLNNGSYTINPSSGLTAFGLTACSGVVQLSTGSVSTNNSGAHISVGYNNVSVNLLSAPSRPAASSTISKLELETLLCTDSTLFNVAASLSGSIKVGFFNGFSVGSDPGGGVWIEFFQNGGTTDTTFWVAWNAATSGKQRSDTGVTVSANTTYRIYLSVEQDSAGNYTTNYKIKNVTTGTNTEGTASPANVNRYPAANQALLAGVYIHRMTNITTTPINVYVDYVGVRTRKVFPREILLGSV